MTPEAVRPQGETDLNHRRGRIVSLLVGTLLVFAATFVGVLWFEHDEEITAAEARADNFAKLLSAHLDRTFGAVQSALNQLAATSERFGGPHAGEGFWSPVLTATLSGLDAVGSVNVVDADGLVIASTNRR